MIVTFDSGESFETEFDNGDRVYLVTDPEQHERIVTVVHVYSSKSFGYDVSLGSETSFHYEFELSLERDLAKALDIMAKSD